MTARCCKNIIIAKGLNRGRSLARSGRSVRDGDRMVDDIAGPRGAAFSISAGPSRVAGGIDAA
ncbi:MAG: hypothetical protein A3E77_16910 [Sphingopyxis sp. RIFCSPHIGHO2_12_FULL_65_19]|nr:MAG: hypothetical protein A3E77_16910 [Sphingopyxis sp. RIFCSPHIGHO2_12_FULL_65_19]